MRSPIFRLFCFLFLRFDWAEAHRISVQTLATLPNPERQATLLIKAVIGAHQQIEESRLKPEDWILWRWWLFRRSRGVPLAYLQQKVEWEDFTWYVNRRVLIPRPETEQLAVHIRDFPRKFTPTQLWDLGTGSGCLGISAAKYLGLKSFHAIDSSARVKPIVKKNAKTHDLKVHFSAENLRTASFPEQMGIITANLPYLPQSMKDSLSSELDWEPSEALFVLGDGLDLYRGLKKRLNSIQFQELWIEFLPSQKDEIAQIFAAPNYHCQFFPAVTGEIFFALITPAS